MHYTLDTDLYSFFREKRTIICGIEPLTFNLQLKTQYTKPSGNLKNFFIKLSQNQDSRLAAATLIHIWISSWIQTMYLWRGANLLQSMSFYNFFLCDKSTASFGLEPPTSNLQSRTLFTKPSSHVLLRCFRLKQYHRFLDLNISQCLGHFMRGKKCKILNLEFRI